MSGRDGKTDDEAFIWTKQQARKMAKSQSGASNCGATALLNVLLALEVPLPPTEVADKAVRTNQRKYGVSASEYLAARSIAGCTGENIVEGCEKIAGDKVMSRFFAFYPSRTVNLHTWLAQWIRRGCCGVATLNTQEMYGADYWHHQMIYGVDTKGVHVTNGVEVLSFEEIQKGLVSPSVLKIDVDDVRRCRPFDPQSCDALGETWKTLKVSKQVSEIGTSGESYVHIPAAYKAGITLFARKGTSAAAALSEETDLKLRGGDPSDMSSYQRANEFQTDVEELCGVLEVPTNQAAAFQELYQALAEELSGKPSRSLLTDWEDHLKRARAQVDVESFINTHEADFRRTKTVNGAADLRHADMLRSRFRACGIYSSSLSLEELLKRCLEENRESSQQPRPSRITTQNGVWGVEHAAIRKRSYPYVPALGDSTGEAVIEARDQNDQLLGYVIQTGGNYIFDLAVDPRVQGCAVGVALVGTLASSMQRNGVSTMCLDVRRCNEPAVRFYNRLGFRIVKKTFPPWYDWHGGFHLEAETNAIAAHLETVSILESKI
ncbi:hypothetical protein CYMTET_37692 [Cymbomonas tetramitiformis]|uniref:N-acetyltransferase domain-containing protein n=1 Tax=Cymbomonas tetramitiformis TaxID=36881 RepID=A0AAE0CDD2_9CHLO|nr:hypothetical protein CYMTET_37692 [Cymbomonas tetramitiformis]